MTVCTILMRAFAAIPCRGAVFHVSLARDALHTLPIWQELGPRFDTPRAAREYARALHRLLPKNELRVVTVALGSTWDFHAQADPAEVATPAALDGNTSAAAQYRGFAAYTDDEEAAARVHAAYSAKCVADALTADTAAAEAHDALAAEFIATAFAPTADQDAAVRRLTEGETVRADTAPAPYVAALEGEEERRHGL